MKKHNIQVRGKRALAFLPFYLLTFLLFSACAHEEDDLFPESAAQRINHSVAEWKQVLADDPNGWVMEYLPADGSYGGYLFTVKLNGTEAVIGTVDVTFNDAEGYSYPPGTEETSKYSVKAEQGVILSFDTYSQFFHFFSGPQGSSAPDGYQGDYEFVLNTTSADGDTVYMKGKKYGNDIRMYKLSGMDSKEFVDRVVQVRTGLWATDFSGIQVGDKEFPVKVGRNMVITTDTTTSETSSVPLFFTPNGFHLYKPVTLNGNTFQDFNMDEDRQAIVADDDAAELKVSATIKQQIEQPKGYGTYGGTHNGWMLDGMDTETQSMYDYMLNHSAPARLKAWLPFRGICLGPCSNNRLFRQNIKQFLAIHWDFIIGYIPYDYGVNYTYNPQDETLTIELLDAKFFTSGYEVFEANVVEPFVKRIIDNSPYKVTLNDFFIKTYMKLESVNNPNVYYEFNLREEFS